MEVTLKNGLVFKVDEDVWLRRNLFLYNWTCGRTNPYVHANEIGDSYSKNVKLHRLLLNAHPGEQVDHINGDSLDNRLCNLRICTNAQNQANTKSRGGSSKFKGVSWNARRKQWLVAFRANGQYVFVGWFKDERKAAKAYDREAFARLGEFARLNFLRACSSVG